MLTNESPFNARSDRVWLEHIEDCNFRMLAECETRAKLMHAHFIWDFVEHGGPVIRSYRKKTNEGAVFEREELTPAVQETMLETVHQLFRDYKFIVTQCRHLVP